MEVEGVCVVCVRCVSGEGEWGRCVKGSQEVAISGPLRWGRESYRQFVRLKLADTMAPTRTNHRPRLHDVRTTKDPGV
jgi:hypothetical protein